MERPRAEIIDLIACMQDVVLDAQHDWLEELAVTDELRWEIFDHLCLVTGELLDSLLVSDEFKSMLTD